MRTPPVPTDNQEPKTPTIGNKNLVIWRGNKELSAGTPPPLREISLLQKKQCDIWKGIKEILGSYWSPKRGEMIMRALAMQAFARFRLLFASAAYIATPFGNEKTWDRTLKRLRELGLVRVYRLQDPITKRLSTNLIDLSLLWEILLSKLRELLTRVPPPVEKGSSPEEYKGYFRYMELSFRARGIPI